MNHYEAVTLLVPEFADKDVQKYVDDLTELLGRHGAAEISPARVDRRALAYPVRKRTEGYYVYLRFDAPAGLPAEVKSEFKHREGILRLAFVRRPRLAPEPELAGRPAPPPLPEEPVEDIEVPPEPAEAGEAPERDDG
ncbi:MAG: 30S ribosomal protein S6 [bacterium]